MGTSADQISRLRSALAGRYKLEREIGRGGMSIVYRARDVRLDRDIALKVLRPELTVSLGAERFLREIQIAARLQHPHILPLHDSGEVDGLFFYTMPFVAGESLRTHLATHGPLPVPEAVRIGREVSSALTHAHEQGFLHRDIKPENILLSSGLAMVADFGIAQALIQAGLEPLTDSGIVVGTPGYMSPEQSAGHTKLDARTDIYSLGCVVYEMLTGAPPFTGPTPQAVLARHIHEHPPSIRVVRQTVPTGLEQTINRSLAKSPADRFSSAIEFGDALGATESKDASLPNWRRFLWTGLALGVGILAWVTRDRWFGGETDGTSPALDPTRVAVLYFADRSQGGILRPVAHGLTEDLIDKLSSVQGLHVVSPSGVRPYSGTDISIDSIARALGVGTLVEGSVEQPAGGLRVRVRLVDATTGQQLQSAVVERPRGDLFALQADLADSISRFLRRQLGREVRIREQRGSTKSVAAWELVRQAGELTEDATALLNVSRDPGSAVNLLRRADSVLLRATAADAQWTEPLIAHGWVAAQLSELSSADSQLTWMASAVEYANRALRIAPVDPRALELRGTMRYWSWQARGGDPAHLQSLLDSAEQDLRTAVTANPGLARGWNTLSMIYQERGDWTQANITLRRAIDADAYLTETARSMQVLIFASLERGDSAGARSWCQQGRTQFPNEYFLWECDLNLLGWLSNDSADAGRAWKLVRTIESRDTANRMAMGWGVRRMLVAAILARSGLSDSARRVTDRTRAQASPEVLQTLDLYEAYVFLELPDRKKALQSLARYLHAFPQSRDQIAHMRWFESLHADSVFRRLVR
jgi:serine/threonine-protein kinase